MGINLSKHVPFRATCFGVSEWSNEATASSVHMDRNVSTGLGLILVEDFGYFFHWFIVAGVGAAQDDKHPNGVLINVLLHQLRVEPEVTLLADIQNASFDFEIPREFFQSHLCVRTHDNIGLRGILSLGLTFLLPAPLHCKTSEVDCF